MRLRIHGVKIDIDSFGNRDYQAVRRLLETRLADRRVKNRQAIRDAFAEAVVRGCGANPSDLWHHVVYRSYLDIAGRHREMADPGQSWKRASGDAFEIFLVDYYNRLLQDTDIRLVHLISGGMKEKARKVLRVEGRVGSSKLDIAISSHGTRGQVLSEDSGRIIGVIHAKVSLAERVSDDVPASIAIMNNGYVSFLATLDVKSFPLSHIIKNKRAYINRGELGTPENPSDKRMYIEEHGSFDGCFSFNLRTVPSPPITNSGKRIFVGGLDGSKDDLYRALIAAADARR